MGLGLFWKPTGPTSSQFLGKVKRELELGGPSRKGIGHTGTLDPFAEGWMLVGWGEGTKLLSGLQKLDKIYEAEIFLGASTETLDNSVPLTSWSLQSELNPQEEDLKKFLLKKIGKQSQIPPLFSAKKIEGVRAYELARKQQEVELKACEIELFSAQHLSLVKVEKNLWKWTVRVHVSSGTYIRAFARDWAKEIFGHEACLSALKRIGIGRFLKESQESVFFKNYQDLETIFPSNSLKFSTVGALEAVWVTEAQRWRYFNEDPLKLRTEL
jgi:tRNA pseudouridine55 synthase